MSSKYVYTYGDITVSPYKFEKILELKIIRELNEHAKLHISGIISDENDAYVEKANQYEKISISIKDDEDKTTDLFNGVVTNISIEMKNNIRVLEVEALSQTFLMDIRKINRSYQNVDLSYDNIINSINDGYGSAQMVDNLTYNAKLNGLIIQYRETDWEFIKRLASHFNGALVPECQLGEIKYSLGGLGESAPYELDEYNYSIKKGLHEYKVKASDEDYDLDDTNLISYEVTTHMIMNLYNQVAFQQRKLLVYRCEIEMVEGQLINKYILRDETGMKVRKIYNDRIAGVSLQGRVLATQKDEVKVSLEADGSPTSLDGTKWFQFATIFSSPDGTGWYCMPEIEDVVRLYFPDNEEDNAYVINSLHYPYSTSNGNRRSNPDVKSFSTKYGKEIVMRPGGIDIISGGSTMSLSDSGGINVSSDSQISMSGSSISISGGDVSISGTEGVTLTQSGASITVKDNVVMSGGKINTQ